MCPNCGHKYAIVPQRQSQGFSQRMHKFEASSFWKLNPETNQFEPQNPNNDNDNLSEFRAPARPPTVESDVKTPFMQAVITGVFLAPLAAGAIYGIAETPLLPACAIGAWVSIGGAWLVRMNVMTKLLWTIEKYTNRDLNKDNHKGKPPDQEPTGRTVIRERAGGVLIPESWDLLDAERQVADICRFAELAWDRQQNGQGVGQKAMRGLPLPSGFEVNDDIHRWILDDLEQAKCIRRTGNGWRLEARPTTVQRLITSEAW